MIAQAQAQACIPNVQHSKRAEQYLLCVRNKRKNSVKETDRKQCVGNRQRSVCKQQTKKERNCRLKAGVCALFIGQSLRLTNTLFRAVKGWCSEQDKGGRVHERSSELRVQGERQTSSRSQQGCPQAPCQQWQGRNG